MPFLLVASNNSTSNIIVICCIILIVVIYLVHRYLSYDRFMDSNKSYIKEQKKLDEIQFKKEAMQNKKRHINTDKEKNKILEPYDYPNWVKRNGLKFNNINW